MNKIKVKSGTAKDIMRNLGITEKQMESAARRTKMNDILKELTESEATEFTDQQMGALGIAANRLINKQIEIKDAETELKNLKAQERKINQEEIPAMMENLGFETITLSDGRKIAVKDAVQCGIAAADRPRAYVWMDENGHGDLIKIALTAKFARGDRDMADECFEALVDVGASPNQIESVHAGTLKAWAREELAQGHSLPSDLFKIHVVKITTVK